MLMGLPPERVGQLAARPDMLPLASHHGGFLFARTDALGFICELHTLFTPEGWGREALIASIEALNAIWVLDYQMVTTFEVRANPKSRPPRSFAFTQAGDWRASTVGDIRLWCLSRRAWDTSPARRRSCLH